MAERALAPNADSDNGRIHYPISAQTGVVILPRHELLHRDGFAIAALQHGHRGRLLTRVPIRGRRWSRSSLGCDVRAVAAEPLGR
jgi:hypothetical protein